jgi:hypothetical protein
MHVDRAIVTDRSAWQAVSGESGDERGAAGLADHAVLAVQRDAQ